MTNVLLNFTEIKSTTSEQSIRWKVVFQSQGSRSSCEKARRSIKGS